jgi:hypothetical protein
VNLSCFKQDKATLTPPQELHDRQPYSERYKKDHLSFRPRIRREMNRYTWWSLNGLIENTSAQMPMKRGNFVGLAGDASGEMLSMFYAPWYV